MQFYQTIMMAVVGSCVAMVGSAQDIYLLIGQSNMAGRAPYVEAEDLNRLPRDQVFILNDQDAFVSIGPYPFINHYSTIRKSAAQIGPGVSFAEAMLEARPNEPVYLISNARGGTSIKEWVKGTEYYNEAVRRTRIAQTQGTLRGILWHQGETDYRQIRSQPTPETRHAAMEAYFDLLHQFIADLRADLNEPTVPFIAGQVNRSFTGFNERVLQLPADVPYSAVVSTEGLETMDESHFDRDAMEKLGRRYADALLKMLSHSEKDR